jgi:hypothetical protein
MLRIDVDHHDSPGVLYSSPSTNPFYGSKQGRDEIYALGFRNPWRFSFDSVTDELYVGDVGQDAVEEIDVVERGGNYGWRVFEGWLCTNLGPAPCIPENYISPIHTTSIQAERADVRLPAAMYTEETSRRCRLAHTFSAITAPAKSSCFIAVRKNF